MKIADPFDFAGRVALITGGGTGIGRTTACLFAGRGADVVLAGRKRDKLDETAAMVEALGRKAIVVPTNVKEPAECEALAVAARAAHGRIDFLINNAGGSRTRTWETWSLDDFDAMIDLNLRSVWVLSRAVAPHIRDAGGGAIVNISSGASFYPVPVSAPYGIAKAGVNNLTSLLAVELAAWKIRVNCIAPGPIRTEGFDVAMDRIGADPDDLGGDNLLGRPGWPQEIGWPILFLCSPGAGFMTGETLNIGGGPIGWQKRAPERP